MVLKRGDRDAGPLAAVSQGQLDEPRRFARSYSAAWQVWTTRFNLFILHLWWKPAALCGVVGVAWLLIRSQMYFRRFDWREIVLDVVALWLVLWVWSAMRIVQQGELEAINAPAPSSSPRKSTVNKVADTKSPDAPKRVPLFQRWGLSFQHLKRISASAMVCAMPLLVATLLSYLIIYIPSHLNAPAWVDWISVAAAFVVLIPAAGTVQSYLEVEKTPLRTAMWKGLRLNTHYWGGMAVMWIISLCLLAVAGGIILIGEVIVNFAVRDMFEASLIGETMRVPGYVIALRYVVMFVLVFVLTLVQGLWSLPQQIHIRSIIIKDRSRAARRAQKTEAKRQKAALHEQQRQQVRETYRPQE